MGLREPQHCPACRSMSAEALASAGGYLHSKLLRDLNDTGHNCLLCLKLWGYFQKEIDSSEDYTNLRLRLGPKERRRLYDRGEGMLLAASCDNSSTKNPDPWSLPDVYVMTPVGDAAEKHGIPAARSQLSNTQSIETFEFIQSNLAECFAKHYCPKPIVPQRHGEADTMVTPARLIDVESYPCHTPGNADAVRLFEVPNATQSLKYMTLSHCWGKGLKNKHKTLSSNLSARATKILVRELPPTFRDAISITRRLGVRYLWIDSLCIIQDSEQDWASESLKMGGIYQNSFLTIAASQGKNSLAGCFNKRSVTHDRLKSKNKHTLHLWKITTDTEKAGKSTIMLLIEERGHEPLPLRSSPLSQRGWVFQERLLSPRTIHFTTSQVVWECRDHYRLEDLLPAPMRKWEDSTVSGLLDYGTYDRFILNESDDKPELADFWYDRIVAERYSIRLFSHSADRLIAIAGIAQTFQGISEDRYLAGLWESNLAYGLYFRRRIHRFATIFPPAHKTRRWPSWTWSSHDGEVLWENVREFLPDQRFTLVSNNLKFLGANPTQFSPVSGGHITVTGIMTEVVIEKVPRSSRGSLLLDHHIATFDIDYPNLQKFIGKVPVRLTVLVLGHLNQETGRPKSHLLILEPHGASTSTYMRVGVAVAEFESEENRNAFWDRFDPETINLI
ncbi:HET-domain-containing protein [Stipitochalara longipes BDJ]|nr:HET-domain-containing protein [Stipitochalara longipes BDJ]